MHFAYIHKTTWYRFKNHATDKRIFNSGRPIPGFSYNKFGIKIYDADIVVAIAKLRAHEYLTIAGGYKKLKYYLYNMDNIIINKKKVYRLCKENNFLLTKSKKTKIKRQISCNRRVTKPNQVWEFDIKYGYIHGQNRFFYILVYIDVFSRKIVHYYVGLHCKAKHLAATFSTALRKASIGVNDGLVIRSDNGPQMTSKMFYNYLLNEVQHKVEHEFIPCATPNKDAHVESFYSILESEFIPLYYFRDFKDVYIKFYNFIEFYNNVRVHSSLKYRTPNQVLELYNNNQLPKDIKQPRI